MKRIIGGIVLAILISGCESGSDCDTAAHPAIIITVVNLNEEPICEDVLAIIREGDYADTLKAYELNTTGEVISLAGAYERPGLYTLTVTSDIYASFTESGIRMRNDDCHVYTHEMLIELAEK